MKTRILICLLVIGILPASKSARADSTNRLHNPANVGNNGYSSLSSAVKAGTPLIAPRGKFPVVHTTSHSLAGHRARVAKPASLDSVTKLLRLKLYIDQYNYDDIVIGFNAGASPAYNFNEDSKYLPGIDAPEGLSSFSSDGVPLSINLLPLPKQIADVIRLDVETQSSRSITLKRTELDSLPSNYSVWLVDNYKKDSIDLRVDSNYVFTINKSDTATFGAWRFKVVVRQAEAAPFKLVNFNATKGSGGAEITWATQNESNDTHFAIERSSDDGSTFGVLDSLVSCGKGSYTYTDNNPPAASDEYRIRMTDGSGTVSYSNVVTLIYSVSAPAATNAISLYPNPTNGMINLTINKNSSSDNSLAVQSTATFAASTNTSATSYSIRIVNISGTTIKSAVSSTGSWQDNVSNLSAGTYIITVMDNSNNKLVGRSTFIKM